MAKNKRSFFDRLTGSISVSDEPSRGLTDLENELEAEKNWAPEPEEEEGELSIDLYETPNDIIVRAMVAGVRPDDLTIDISREMVTIRGSRESMKEETGNNYYHKELFWGSFVRTIILPAEIETEEVEATEKHGLLTIKLPKIDKDKRAKIKVKSI